MSEGGADAFVVDLTDVIADPTEREHLLEWGSRYLSSTDDDQQIRAAHLALEFRDHCFRAARARGHRISFWQARLGALAMLTACVRRRAARESEEHNAVRH
jgi:hypothetical protein